MSDASTKHVWHFFRAGGFDQVRLDSGADLAALDQLDQKLWFALACPTQGLQIESATLSLVDADQDGRIRAPELIGAVKWALGLLRSPDGLVRGGAALPLSALDETKDEARLLASAARRVLEGLGKAQASDIGVPDVIEAKRVFAEMRFNGDGIVPAESAGDEKLAAAITDIVHCTGGATDIGGKKGVDGDTLTAFLEAAAAYDAWQKKAESDPSKLPLGDGTAAAATAFHTLQPKVDDYFARCRVAAFDERAAGLLNRDEKEYAVISSKLLSLGSQELRDLPLSRIAPGRPLPLSGATNPAWSDDLAAFRTSVVSPLLGARDMLTEADWASIKGRFAPFDAWETEKAGVPVEKLGVARVRELLKPEVKAGLEQLIAQDKAMTSESAALANLEKIVRFHRDLGRLCRNFVNFADFYGRREKAIFQAGTLYLDTRSCDLCIRVLDAGKHASMAPVSASYLAYCDCTRKATGESMTIVAAFTAGDGDDLVVGRNGIFYDRDGKDWDATITKIVDNPISLGQAFWAPYKKVVRFVEEQVAKRAADADAAANTRLQGAATEGLASAETPPAAAAAGAAPKIDTGVIAALGIAAAGLGGMLGAIVSAFIGLGPKMPLGILGIVLLISGPSMLLAWLKLRRRSLGPLLEANGWAINATARINVPLGSSLTAVAELPEGSHRDLNDPFAPPPPVWKKWLVVTAILLALAAAFAWRATIRGVLGIEPPTTSPAPAAPAGH